MSLFYQEQEYSEKINENNSQRKKGNVQLK